MKQRNVYGDCTKGILIFLVILGHCIQYGSGATYLNKELFWENKIFQWVYSFHMPLFALISGYFLGGGRYKLHVKEFLLKQLKCLILPIFTWQLLYYPLNYIFLNKTENFLLGYLHSTYGCSWFLRGIFWCSMIIYCIEQYCNKRKKIAYSILIFAMVLLPDIGFTELYKFIFLYYVIGFKLYSLKLKSPKYIYIKLKKEFCRILFLLFSLWIFLMMFFEKSKFIYTTGITVFSSTNLLRQINIDFYRWVTGLTGCTVVLMLIYILCLKAKFISNLLAMIGRETLGIYIVSTYIISFCMKRLPFISECNYFFVFTSSGIILLISYFAIKIIHHIRILDILLLGK